MLKEPELSTFKAGEQHRELLEAQQQASAMSAKADALKNALALSEAEHARREYASSIGMASPTRLLKSTRLHSPGSRNPGARKKHASRTSPPRQGAQSRFGGPTEDGTAVVHLNFDGGICAAGNDLLMDSISVTNNGDFDPYLADDIGVGGVMAAVKARNGASTHSAVNTPSILNDHMPE
jgi:hypothetical protein